MYHKFQSYDVWFLRYQAWQIEFFVILDHFLPFYPYKNPKKAKFWKNEKMPLEISSFYINVPKIMIICYTILEIWCATDVILIFYFGIFFPPFTPLTTLKNQDFKETKKTPGDIIILHMCTKNNYHIMHSSWNMLGDRWRDRQMEKVTYRGEFPT